MIINLLVKNIFYLFVTLVKRESAVLANNEPHFECFSFICRFSLCLLAVSILIFVAGLALIVEV